MAHEVESMFYVGKKPWHGLGVEVSEDITIPEALKASGLDWYVSKEPLYLQDGTQVPDSFATVRQNVLVDSKVSSFQEVSVKQVLGVVGNRYTVYQNSEAFQWFEPYLDAKMVKLHTAGSLQGGKRVWILAKVNGVFTIAANDDVELYLLLSHAHDGSLEVKVGTTPQRVVCANTLKMAHEDPASKLFKAKHSKSVHQQVEDFKNNIERILFDFEGTVDAYKYLATKPVRGEAELTAYVNNVFGIGVEEVSTRTKNQVNRVTQLFETGMGNNLVSVRGTAWAAYNAVTQWLSYERGNNPDTRINALWFGDGAKFNKRALDCALALGVN